MKYLVILPFLLAGCNKAPDKPDPISQIGCAIGKGIALGLSQEIATQLECSHPEAIQASLVEALQKVKVCEQKSTLSSSSLPSSLCNLAGNALVSSVAAGLLPQAWACSASSAQAKLGGVIKQACDKL